MSAIVQASFGHPVALGRMVWRVGRFSLRVKWHVEGVCGPWCVSYGTSL